MIELLNKDCMVALSKMDDNSVDSIVTDPPYELGFMGKAWDNTGIAYSVEFWKECLRVLKPGGHLLSFGGTRTYHRMACAIEDAGFEIRDQIQYLYGSGFPKSLNIEKQLESKYGRKENTKHDLRPMRDSNLPQEVSDTETNGEVLQSGLSQPGLYGTMQGEEPQEVITDGEEPSMEGGCDFIQKEGELQECPLCKVSKGVYNDGEKGRVYNGTQIDYGNTHGQDITDGRSGSSHRSRPNEQRHYELDAFCEQHRTQEIRRWEGWGTALKPANEPICMARKPLECKTVAENVLKWGTGGINIDATRIKTKDQETSDAVYMRLSYLYSLGCTSSLPVLFCQDFFQHILFALNSYNTKNKVLLRNIPFQDDSQPLDALSAQTIVSNLFPNGVWCGRNDLLKQDFQSDYPAYYRSYGEQLHKILDAAQDSVQKLHGVLSDIYSEQCEQQRSQPNQCNDHPSNLDDFLQFVSYLLLFILHKDTKYLSHPQINNSRFPANVIQDGSDEVVSLFPYSKSTGGSGDKSMGGLGKNGKYGKYALDVKASNLGGLGDEGSASRFFYCAKSSKAERNKGLGEIMFGGLEIIIYLCKNNKDIEIWKDKITIQEENKVQRLVDMGISAKRAIAEYGIQMKGGSDLNIILYGSKILERFLLDTNCIIRTGINSTTVQQILNLLHPYIIKGHIRDVFLKMMDGGSLVVSAENSNTLTIIINEKMGFLLGVNPVVLKMQLQISEKESTNFHSTVKPIALMRYLCRLITPPKGIVLDPFMGSGSTGIGAKLEGFSFIGIEREAEYCKIAEARIEAWKMETEFQQKLF